MFTLKRTFTILGAFAGFIVITATASAQSGLQNSPQAFTFTFNNCNGQQQILGVTTSSASVVFLDSSIDAVFVATSVKVVGAINIAGQPPMPVDFTLPLGAGHGQANGLQGSLVTCTSEPVTFPVVGGTATVTETVTMFTNPHFLSANRSHSQTPTQTARQKRQVTLPDAGAFALARVPAEHN